MVNPSTFNVPPVFMAGDLLKALLLEPERQLVRRDEMRACRSCNRYGILRVVAVAMCDQHEVEGAHVLRGRGTGGVVLDPGIDEDALSARRSKQKRAVPEPGEGERRHVGLGS